MCIRDRTKEEALYFLPQSLWALCRVCSELNDRGHILFLKDPNKVECSWIIINKSVLLSEVTGTIFAPEYFKQHKQLASNTGVVPLSTLTAHFPNHDPKMLIGFLTHLEFCHEISDQELLQLISEQHSQSLNDNYYLFPGLITLNIPDNVWETKLSTFTYHCGWVLQCTLIEQYFSARLLHVLLLRLAFSFALAKSSEETDKTCPAIQRKCSLWKNGIFWGNKFGVETLVEVLSNSKAIVVLMRSKDFGNSVRAVYLQANVINCVLQCVQKFCPQVRIMESLINPAETMQYPLRALSDQVHFTIQEVARAAIETSHGHPTSVVSSTGATLPFHHLLKFEPYAEMNKSAIKTLYSEENSTKIISDQFLLKFFYQVSSSKNAELFIKIFTEEQYCIQTTPGDSDLLQELHKWRSRCEGTYKCLRDKLNLFSIFAGRNILV